MFEIAQELRLAIENDRNERYGLMLGFTSEEQVEEWWIEGDRLFLLVNKEHTIFLWVLARPKKEV